MLCVGLIPALSFIKNCAKSRLTLDAIDAKRNNRYSVTSFLTGTACLKIVYASTLGFDSSRAFRVIHRFSAIFITEILFNAYL